MTRKCTDCAYCDQDNLVCLETFHPDKKSLDPVTGEKTQYDSCYIAVNSLCQGTFKFFAKKSPFRIKMNQLFTINIWKQLQHQKQKYD